MQRSMTLKILRPYDENVTWEELGYLLQGLSFKVCKMSNFCLTHHLLRALKLETENLNPRGHLYCYPRLAEEYPEVPSGIICAAEGRARKVFRQNGASVLRSEMALPTFRKNCSIPVPAAGYSLQWEGDDTCILEVQLLSRQGTKTARLPGRISLVLAHNWRDKTAGAVLRKLTEGTLRRGAANLFREKKDWYISIPYETEAVHVEEDFEPGLVMGVAFGTHSALSYAFNRSPKRGELGGEEILSHQEKYQARRKKIQEQYNWSGRKGHGRDNALKPLRGLYEKERNYRSLVNARYAKWIVEIAEKNRCGVIHVEAGSAPQSGKQNILLARWPLDELRQKIREKAELYGIAVRECTEGGIRERCSRCGAEQESAADRRRFTCEACGYGAKGNNNRTVYISADYNAARNLAVWEAGNEKAGAADDI